MSKLLEVSNLAKSFGSLKVFDGVSLTLARGESKVIVGPSGTGKSTLLRCINRLIPPDAGVVRLDDVPVEARNINEMRSKIGYVFQDFNLFLHLRVIDNVRIGLEKVRKLPRRDATEIAMNQLRRVGMDGKADAYPAELSGGQQQRVSIARALAMEPKVILFDEPTSALDPQLTEEVLLVMRSLVENGVTMLVVTHEMSFARSAADEVIVMQGGRIVQSAHPDEVFDERGRIRVLQGAAA